MKRTHPTASTGSSSLPDDIIDCRGLKCPLPVLKTEKRLGQIKAGATVTVLATDPIARIDIPLFCTQHGHQCEMTVEGDVMRFAIVKG
jgi:tRNA 2-thiouridine synthesizing protein A